MSYAEYSDITFFELSLRIAGYTRRWADKWRHTRALYTLILNVNSKKPKRETDIMALPGDNDQEDDMVIVDGVEMTLGDYRRLVSNEVQLDILKYGSGAGVGSKV